MTEPPVTNPLTSGVYRIDLPCELASAFGRWRRAQRGRVHVIELENGPGGTARVNFVVFGKAGAFPFGKLGRPVRGQIVGALPDFADVVSMVLPSFPALMGSLAGKAMADFVAAATAPEMQALRQAILVAQANMGVVRSELEAVKNGTSSNPAAVLHNAAQLTKQSLEGIVQAAGAVPIQFSRNVVNAAVTELQKTLDAIIAAPGKALHAVSKFPGLVVDNWLKPFVLPAEGALLGVGAIVLAGYLSLERGKVGDFEKWLAIGGAALALLGGGTLVSNVNELLPREPKT